MLRESISSLFGGNRVEVVCECRRCGQTVDAATDDCPHCGPDADIVTYELD